ncbi:MAG: class I SAM-dependent methyltransferase, partial [Geminicoccales bacterium]
MSRAPSDRFAPAWLALREGYDHAARSKPLARAFLRSLPRGACIADLACGSGANARYLSSLGRRDLCWDLIDADPALLTIAEGGDARRLDLARPRRSLDLGRCHGVTASAFLDLVSGPWIDALIGDAARHGLPMLFALTVDGRVAFSPGDAGDGALLNGFRRDQRRDKGFGPALGPDAPRRLAAA